MHPAVTKMLGERAHCADMERLLFGCVLPDGATDGNSHLIKTDVGKKTLDLGRFRSICGAKLTGDALFMGHCPHLVQDICFRHFVYREYAWDPKPEGNAERLHNDYALLNPYLSEKYGLCPDMGMHSARACKAGKSSFSRGNGGSQHRKGVCVLSA